MFSGRHQLKTESDGSHFIDRDGTHFRYILNYLRDGCLKEGTIPSSQLSTNVQFDFIFLYFVHFGHFL
jgi:hypothetical protein